MLKISLPVFKPTLFKKNPAKMYPTITGTEIFLQIYPVKNATASHSRSKFKISFPISNAYTCPKKLLNTAAKNDLFKSALASFDIVRSTSHYYLEVIFYRQYSGT